MNTNHNQHQPINNQHPITMSSTLTQPLRLKRKSWSDHLPSTPLHQQLDLYEYEYEYDHIGLYHVGESGTLAGESSVTNRKRPRRLQSSASAVQTQLQPMLPMTPIIQTTIPIYTLTSTTHLTQTQSTHEQNIHEVDDTATTPMAIDDEVASDDLLLTKETAVTAATAAVATDHGQTSSQRSRTRSIGMGEVDNNSLPSTTTGALTRKRPFESISSRCSGSGLGAASLDVSDMDSEKQNSYNSSCTKMSQDEEDVDQLTMSPLELGLIDGHTEMDATTIQQQRQKRMKLKHGHESQLSTTVVISSSSSMDSTPSTSVTPVTVVTDNSSSVQYCECGDRDQAVTPTTPAHSYECLLAENRRLRQLLDEERANCIRISHQLAILQQQTDQQEQKSEVFKSINQPESQPSSSILTGHSILSSASTSTPSSSPSRLIPSTVTGSTVSAPAFIDSTVVPVSTSSSAATISSSTPFTSPRAFRTIANEFDDDDDDDDDDERSSFIDDYSQSHSHPHLTSTQRSFIPSYPRHPVRWIEPIPMRPADQFLPYLFPNGLPTGWKY